MRTRFKKFRLPWPDLTLTFFRVLVESRWKVWVQSEKHLRRRGKFAFWCHGGTIYEKFVNGEVRPCQETTKWAKSCHVRVTVHSSPELKQFWKLHVWKEQGRGKGFLQILESQHGSPALYTKLFLQKILTKNWSNKIVFLVPVGANHVPHPKNWTQQKVWTQGFRMVPLSFMGRTCSQRYANPKLGHPPLQT